MVRTPIARPTHSLACLLGKNEPWPQSCWIMNRRTSRPAANGASANESQTWPLREATQHRGPERGEGREGDHKLEDGARRVRPAVGSERLRPVARRRRAVYFDRRHHSDSDTSRFLRKSVVERVIDGACTGAGATPFSNISNSSRTGSK